MKNKLVIGLAIASITGFASSYALANPTQIKLYDGYGNNSGGEFVGVVTGGTNTSGQVASILYGGASFLSFCLERSETFTPGNTLYVKGAPNTGAINGGYGSAAMPIAVGDVPGTSTFDPISSQTAYLFTQYSKNALSGFTYALGTARANDATDLQSAIWYLENELGSTAFGSLTTKAQGWINEANTKITNNLWSGIGDVRALNLYKSYNSTTGVYSDRSQDQLFITTPVPEPETYAMMLAGLGLIGFLGKRRRRNLL